MFDKPILGDSKPIIQLLSFLGIAVASMSIFSMIAMLLIKPMYGVDLLSNQAALSNVGDPNVIGALKVIQLFNAIGLFLFPSLLFPYLITKDRSSFLNLKQGIKPLWVVLAIAIMFTALPLINWTAFINSKLTLPDGLQWFETQMRLAEQQAATITEAFLQFDTNSDFLVNFVLLAILPAIGEELMFRGVIQKLFIKMTNNHHVSIWITAIMFSALHMQFFGFLPRMLLGALLGYFYFWSKSIWLPILGHFVNNGAAVIMAFMIARGSLEEGTDEIGGSTEEYVFTVLSVVVVTGLIWFLRRRCNLTQAEVL